MKNEVLDFALIHNLHYGTDRINSACKGIAMINRTEAVVTIVGTSGTATTRDQIVGLVDGIYLDYDTSAPSTVDLAVAENSVKYPQTILTKLNTNSDQWYYPRKPLVSGVDGSALSGPVDFYNVNDFLTFTISQAVEGQVYRAVVLWDDLK